MIYTSEKYGNAKLIDLRTNEVVPYITSVGFDKDMGVYNYTEIIAPTKPNKDLFEKINELFGEDIAMIEKTVRVPDNERKHYKFDLSAYETEPNED